MTRFTTGSLRCIGLLLAVAAMILGAQEAKAQNATDITGLYYTGELANGSLASAGQTDAHWNVTYASTDGGSSKSTSNMGAAYIISPASIAGSGYTANTTTAQWITAPGAYVSSSTSSAQNTGGDYLPGNGNSGGTEGVYIYTLAFQVVGSGSAGTAVTNDVQVTMTLSADDQYSVYVDPSGNGNKVPTGKVSATATSAWTNKTQITLQNYGSPTANNANFVIGTNYIVVVVDNTNNITGTSSATDLNASGLLVYQTSNAEINGAPIPEVAPWLPLVGVLGCYGLVVRRRKQAACAAAAA
ncbi:MAG TPA: hypothetical protein VFE25_07230 [Opitutaceae bacterium]|jgi:hypothetical protein|nr:hypothetical protein [Opitutaceae bacterium]